jgi:hypothetical protein
MKHCHFSILYNELPFLKQKLPFLYKNFDQIIFFDLNTFTDPYKFSTDGSHEYIKNYPDPENKITLIEDLFRLRKAQPLGSSNLIKRKMFSLGSEFVKPDMDTFWCTDMDELFSDELIKELEDVINNHPDGEAFDVDHLLFWKDLDIMLCESLEKPEVPFFTRIARHKEGNKYGHCSLGTQYSNHQKLSNRIYHFAYVGEPRTSDKLFKYYNGTKPLYKSTWDADWRSKLKPGKLLGYPVIHPNPAKKMGITPYPGDLREELSYIDFDELSNDLNCKFEW